MSTIIGKYDTTQCYIIYDAYIYIYIYYCYISCRNQLSIYLCITFKLYRQPRPIMDVLWWMYLKYRRLLCVANWYQSNHMMSSDGNIFRVTGFLWGESTGGYPHKDQWRRVLMFSLIYAWTNSWANNRDAGDLKRHRDHYDVTVMHRGDRPLGFSVVLQRYIYWSTPLYLFTKHHRCTVLHNSEKMV